jgi:hypothetical protein
MLEGEGLRSLPSETQSKLLGLLSDRIRVIVYHKDISQAGKYFHDVIAVIGLAERRIVGLGTQEWFLAREEEIQRQIKGKYSTGAEGYGDEFELELEEEDM